MNNWGSDVYKNQVDHRGLCQMCRSYPKHTWKCLWNEDKDLYGSVNPNVKQHRLRRKTLDRQGYKSHRRRHNQNRNKH